MAQAKSHGLLKIERAKPKEKIMKVKRLRENLSLISTGFEVQTLFGATELC